MLCRVLSQTIVNTKESVSKRYKEIKTNKVYMR